MYLKYVFTGYDVQNETVKVSGWVRLQFKDNSFVVLGYDFTEYVVHKNLQYVVYKHLMKEK